MCVPVCPAITPRGLITRDQLHLMAAASYLQDTAQLYDAILTAICVLAPGGSLLIKRGSVTQRSLLALLYILAVDFESVRCRKSHTARPDVCRVHTCW